MSRQLVQLYEAREVFATEARAQAAVEEAAAQLADPGVTFHVVAEDPSRPRWWYGVARRKATRQIVGYVGVAWED